MKSYRNMDLELFSYQKDADGGACFCVYAPTSGLPRDQAKKATLKPSVRGLLQRLELRQLNAQELIELGKELAELLFPLEVRQVLVSNLQSLGPDEGLRIRLKMDTYALADLPWEYTYLATDDLPQAHHPDQSFLALNRRISLVRNEGPPRPNDSISPMDREQLHITTLLSDPDRPPEYPALGLAEEIDKIRVMLSKMENKPSIHIQLYPNGTIEALEDILYSEPDVLHFAGYSRFEGDLCVSYGADLDRGAVVLQDTAPFSAKALALNLQDRGIRLVMLGACAAGRRNEVNAWTCVAPALTRHASIPAVVGLQYTIDHDSIVAFCRNFYRTLNDGKSIDAAVSDGRQAIYNLHHGQPEYRDWGVPVVYLRTTDPILFPRRADPAGQGNSLLPQREQPAVQRDPPPEPRPTSPLQGEVDKRALRNAMILAFTDGELETLCNDIEQDLQDDGVVLAVSLEIVGGGTRPEKVLNLIQYLDRRSHLSYLVQAVRRERPALAF
jgi:hypothetical protein